MFSLIVNFSEELDKRTLYQSLRHLAGPHEISIKPAGKSRTVKQLKLYFGVYVEALRQYLAKQGEPKSVILLHKALADRFLKEPVFCDKTGELIGSAVKSTSELTTKEMAEYLDNVETYLRETFGIQVPSPTELSSCFQLTHGGPSMLCLSRERGQKIIIGGNITVEVYDIQGGKVRLAISAPKDVSVDREEIYYQKLRDGDLPQRES